MFARTISAFRLGRTQRGKTEKQGNDIPEAFTETCSAIGKNTNIRGYDVFVREKYSDVEAGSFTQKRRRVDTAWKDLRAERKAHYNGRADAENDHRDEILELPCGEAMQRAKAMPKTSAMTAKRQICSRAVADMQKHGIWDSASRLCSFGSGLRPSKVSNATDEHIKQKTKALFDFEPRTVPNVRGTMQPLKPCCMLYGGLCHSDPYRSRAQCFTNNLFFGTVRLGIAKSLPMTAAFSIKCAGNCFGEVHSIPYIQGVGEIAVTLRAELVDQPADYNIRQLSTCTAQLREINGGELDPSSSLMVLRSLLRNDQEPYPHDNIDGIDNVSMDWYEFEDASTIAIFRVRIGACLGSSNANLRVAQPKKAPDAAAAKADLPFPLNLITKHEAAAGAVAGKQHEDSDEDAPGYKPDDQNNDNDEDDARGDQLADGIVDCCIEPPSPGGLDESSSSSSDSEDDDDDEEFHAVIFHPFLRV